ncbi:MAG: hypothetical protein M3N51_06570 [Actinomycetota bacterium]|nr:hypothetical protein [Actinomycetota bacterium]
MRSTAARPRNAMTTISRATMMKVTQGDARPTATRASNAPVTSSLSAVVSRKLPSTVVMRKRRAR